MKGASEFEDDKILQENIELKPNVENNDDFDSSSSHSKSCSDTINATNVDKNGQSISNSNSEAQETISIYEPNLLIKPNKYSYIDAQIARLFKSLRTDAGNDNILVRMDSTKVLLDDAQRIGFVSLCRVSMEFMIHELEGIESRYTVGKKTLNNKDKKLVTVLNDCIGSMRSWSQTIIIKLYKHMEISSDEQVMIEQLTKHDVEPGDLARSLIDFGVINNADTNQDKIDIKWAAICDLFLLLISGSVYDSRSRTLLENIGSALHISELEITRFEKGVTEFLSSQNFDSLGDGFNGDFNDDNGQKAMETREKMNKTKKRLYMGVAAAGGGLVIGLSAGLMAPVIGAGLVAGFGGIGVGGVSGLVASTGGTAMITATGTAIGAKIGLDGMSKRMGDIKTFNFKPFYMADRVNLIVTVPGWISSEIDDVRLPFSTVDPVMGDLYSLLWEPEMLQKTGDTFTVMAKNWLFKQGIQEILKQTVLGTLMASIKIPMALTQLGYLIDNPWHVSLDRAWACGKLLADTLLQRNLGARPVTLVGFSLGSRVIYSCLLELAKQKAYGLVQDVYLFGAPIVVKQAELVLGLTVVSGKLINGYSRKDWILGYLFRTTNGGLGKVAGLAPVKGYPEWKIPNASVMTSDFPEKGAEGLPDTSQQSEKTNISENPTCGIINFDCTDFVGGHMNYRTCIPLLLKKLSWEVLNEDFEEAVDLNNPSCDNGVANNSASETGARYGDSCEGNSKTYVDSNQDELMKEYAKARQGMGRRESAFSGQQVQQDTLAKPVRLPSPDIFEEFDDYNQKNETSGIFSFFKSKPKPKPKPEATPASHNEVLFNLDAIKESLENMNCESSQYDWLTENDNDNISFVVPIDDRSSICSSAGNSVSSQGA